LTGKSLLLWPEQGYGDTLQFVRYAALLKAQGAARVVWMVQPALRGLLASAAGIDQLVVEGETPPLCDYWTFPLSLPLHLRSTLDTLPATLPYLHADSERIEHWRPYLPPTGFRVGLVWKGNARHRNDARRSLPSLATLAPLWQIPGVVFVSLQKGPGGPGETEAAEEAARSAMPPGAPLTALGDKIRDFADTAAIVEQLDLVIGVDTAVVHLAGSLGKPCWVLLPAIGTDWRWLHGRNDTPWYPQVMRLFRQSTPGDWRETVETLAQALQEHTRTS
jgi:hypothetical protein